MQKVQNINPQSNVAVSEPSEWPERFRDVYERAVAAYEDGARTIDEMFGRESQAFLASIGTTAQEQYDFVEDWVEVGEPPFETVLAISAVRYEYARSEQQGDAGSPVPAVESFPPGNAQLGRFRWLPRIIAKARAKLRGELPPDLMYSCGADRPFLKGVGMQPAEFLRLVWQSGTDDHKILHGVEESANGSGRP